MNDSTSPQAMTARISSNIADSPTPLRCTQPLERVRATKSPLRRLIVLAFSDVVRADYVDDLRLVAFGLMDAR